MRVRRPGEGGPPCRSRVGWRPNRSLAAGWSIGGPGFLRGSLRVNHPRSHRHELGPIPKVRREISSGTVGPECNFLVGRASVPPWSSQRAGTPAHWFRGSRRWRARASRSRGLSAGVSTGTARRHHTGRIVVIILGSVRHASRASSRSDSWPSSSGRRPSPGATTPRRPRPCSRRRGSGGRARPTSSRARPRSRSG